MAKRIANRMARYGRANPGQKHLAGSDVTPKMQRQYSDILESLRHYHRYRSDAKRKQVAAATVRKLAHHNPLSIAEQQAEQLAERLPVSGNTARSTAERRQDRAG